MTILMLPVSSLTRTLSGDKVEIVNPELSKSLIAVTTLETIAWTFFSSIFSIIYYDFILSTLSAIKVESRRMAGWGFSETIFCISPVLAFYMTANTLSVCWFLLKFYLVISCYLHLHLWWGQLDVWANLFPRSVHPPDETALPHRMRWSRLDRSLKEERSTIEASFRRHQCRW
jgi:hypothetical protein